MSNTIRNDNLFPVEVLQGTSLVTLVPPSDTKNSSGLYLADTLKDEFPLGSAGTPGTAEWYVYGNAYIEPLFSNEFGTIGTAGTAIDFSGTGAGFLLYDDERLYRQPYQNTMATFYYSYGKYGMVSVYNNLSLLLTTFFSENLVPPVEPSFLSFDPNAQKQYYYEPFRNFLKVFNTDLPANEIDSLDLSFNGAFCCTNINLFIVSYGGATYYTNSVMNYSSAGTDIVVQVLQVSNGNSSLMLTRTYNRSSGLYSAYSNFATSTGTLNATYTNESLDGVPTNQEEINQQFVRNIKYLADFVGTGTIP